MRDFLCGLGLGHTGTWAYDRGPQQLGPSDLAGIKFDWERGSGTWAWGTQRSLCSQTRICLRCGEKSSRIEHAVEHWTPNGWFSSTESGVCIRCKRRQTRDRDGG